jgi:hypothetical protein
MTTSGSDQITPDPDQDQVLTDLALSFELPAPIPDADPSLESSDTSVPNDGVTDASDAPAEPVGAQVQPAVKRHWWSRS